jgi:hypothetical protein
MGVEARLIGSTMYWPAIARRYDRMATKLTARHHAARTLSTAKRAQEVLDGLAKVS